MDLTRMIAPKSDQKNADDFIAGPMTFTITAEIEYDSEQQPAGLVLDGDTAHPYKPCKSMGRVLTAAWGKESYVGRRLTLFTDPTVKFGGQETGGIRISHMSDIPKTLKLNLTVKKGTKAPFIVAPLVEAARPERAPQPLPRAQGTEPTAADVTACTDLDVLRDWHQTSGPERRAQIRARKAELTAAPTPAADEPTDADWGAMGATA